MTSTQLIVTLLAQPGQEAQLKRETEAVIPQVMEEPYFEAINLLSNPLNPRQLVLVEQWQSREYLLSDAHQKSEHLSRYFSKIRTMLAEPARWELFDCTATYSAKAPLTA